MSSAIRFRIRATGVPRPYGYGVCSVDPYDPVNMIPRHGELISAQVEPRPEYVLPYLFNDAAELLILEQRCPPVCANREEVGAAVTVIP